MLFALFFTATFASAQLLDEETLSKLRRGDAPLHPREKFRYYSDAHGPIYLSAHAGAAVTPSIQSNVNAPIRFDTSEFLSLRVGVDVMSKNTWSLAIEPEFFFYQPNAHIENVLGVSGFNGQADIDSYNFAINFLGRWSFADRWSLQLGGGPVVSYLDAHDAFFSLGNLRTGTASADDEEIGFQALLGIRYFINEHWAIDLENRFLRVNGYHLHFPLADVQTDLETYMTSFGLSYYF